MNPKFHKILSRGLWDILNLVPKNCLKNTANQQFLRNDLHNIWFPPFLWWLFSSVNNNFRNLFAFLTDSSISFKLQTSTAQHKIYKVWPTPGFTLKVVFSIFSPTIGFTLFFHNKFQTLTWCTVICRLWTYNSTWNSLLKNNI